MQDFKVKQEVSPMTHRPSHRLNVNDQSGGVLLWRKVARKASASAHFCASEKRRRNVRRFRSGTKRVRGADVTHYQLVGGPSDDGQPVKHAAQTPAASPPSLPSSSSSRSSRSSSVGGSSPEPARPSALNRPDPRPLVPLRKLFRSEPAGLDGC